MSSRCLDGTDGVFRECVLDKLANNCWPASALWWANLAIANVGINNRQKPERERMSVFKIKQMCKSEKLLQLRYDRTDAPTHKARTGWDTHTDTHTHTSIVVLSKAINKNKNGLCSLEADCNSPCSVWTSATTCSKRCFTSGYSQASFHVFHLSVSTWSAHTLAGSDCVIPVVTRSQIPLSLSPDLQIFPSGIQLSLVYTPTTFAKEKR